MNSKSHTGDFKPGDKLLDTDVVFPELLLNYGKLVAEKSDDLVGKVRNMREAFKGGDFEGILDMFANLDDHLNRTELYIETSENTVHLQLKNCHVSFDVDPHLVEKISDRKLSQSAFDR